MRVLFACEYSGRGRSAFRALGHDAWSCDLLPADDASPYHWQRDVREVIADEGPFDLLIAHPPCTYLTNSGERWMKDNAERAEKRRQAVEFVRWLLSLNIERIGVENPIGHLSTAIRKPDQIIHPWQFGHGETKSTCLWLKGLPKLRATNIVDGREARIHRMSPGPDRWKERSRTYLGIAAAMAEQWGAEAEQEAA